ncbi:hypothetical protein SPRG_10042 [Saprolegnia parasitica CBS 223.65]|uniref:Calponin-homology (CH) domain-containing protein n=1 Tax=Saprolegnia parasitica (strain CBS 223.65) TaxID=695850 RepID=A0A067CAP9_SAPPC|nr:hypothetical protein SPRG_10042 [Saprolegnia parasitica CBS 223.65]KDO23897.1 hypothetical protein SPRG_10042 [Saprolegnia parasitica CBS 223.65]|eukprot:XP_012205367.1 hypothetical protein SPRG_10042 [Saprolegnia parasitica CBS 223.65]
MSRRTTAVDEGWVEVQKHTFTRWANVFLPPDMAVDDLYEDLKDGLRLIALLERISQKPVCAKYNKVVKYRIHMLENLNHVVGFMAKENVTVTNIGSSDIVDGNSKLVLGLMWTIIKHYQLADISFHGVTGKEGLLLWCKDCLDAFPDIVRVTNFTSSWRNGLAFCALISAFHPALIPIESLSPANAAENLALAFHVLEQTFDVPQLLQVEDFEVGVDEKSVLTYLALVFRVFGVLTRPTIVRTPSFHEPDEVEGIPTDDEHSLDDDEVSIPDNGTSDEAASDDAVSDELVSDGATSEEAVIDEAASDEVQPEFEAATANEGTEGTPTETSGTHVDLPKEVEKMKETLAIAARPLVHHFWFLHRAAPGALVVLSLLPRLLLLRACVALYVPVYKSPARTHRPPFAVSA